MDSKSNASEAKIIKAVHASNMIQATRTGLAKSFFSKRKRA